MSPVFFDSPVVGINQLFHHIASLLYSLEALFCADGAVPVFPYSDRSDRLPEGLNVFVRDELHDKREFITSLELCFAVPSYHPRSPANKCFVPGNGCGSHLIVCADAVLNQLLKALADQKVPVFTSDNKLTILIDD